MRSQASGNRILAVVVTYYPEQDLLEKNISAFIDYVDKVMIWENTPSDILESYRFISHIKVDYFGDGINSISHALNFAWKYARDHGFNYLLTMDQDSRWVNFKDFLYRTIYNNTIPFGIYGPTIFGREYEDDFHYGDIITSGMLVPIDILNDVGGYNEEFKIDGIDSYFCYSAMEKGYGVYTVKGCVLKQKFGGENLVSFLKYNFYTYHYSASRLYEIYKSQVIIIRRFHVTAEYNKRFWRNRILKWPVKILLGEGDKWNKYKNICKGLFAGILYKIHSVNI